MNRSSGRRRESSLSLFSKSSDGSRSRFWETSMREGSFDSGSAELAPSNSASHPPLTPTQIQVQAPANRITPDHCMSPVQLSRPVSRTCEGWNSRLSVRVIGLPGAKLAFPRRTPRSVRNGLSSLTVSAHEIWAGEGGAND